MNAKNANVIIISSMYVIPECFYRESRLAYVRTRWIPDKSIRG